VGYEKIFAEKMAAPKGGHQLVGKASQSSRPQARKGFDQFFPAACTSEKTLLGLQTCALSAQADSACAAAGRSFLVKVAKPLFRKSYGRPEGRPF